MEERERLVYFSSDVIKAFCERNPITWGDSKKANGPGNILTPSPAMGVFFSCLRNKKKLFTQQEYANYAWDIWSNWKDELTEEQIEGLTIRLYRNFYVSAIDSLHAWSLLIETGKFDYCLLDTTDDAVSKQDISAWTKDGIHIGIALFIASESSKRWVKYKREHRGAPNKETIDVPLSMDRPRSPGNKRWYSIDDFDPVFKFIDQTREL